MKVAPEVGELFAKLQALPIAAQKQFYALIKQSMVDEARTTPSTRDAVVLYQRISDKLFSYQGVRLPPLATLRSTPIAEELDAAMKWMRGDSKPDQIVTAGLIELAGEAIGRERRDNSFYTNPVSLVRSIPAAMDRAYPGYRDGGVLTQVARSVGEGKLPLQQKIEVDE